MRMLKPNLIWGGVNNDGCHDVHHSGVKFCGVVWHRAMEF